MRCAPLPAALQERLARLIRGKSAAKVREIFRGLPPNVLARAAAGMMVNPTTRIAIEGELARVEGQQP
jgi:hypothetical protein